MNRLIAAQEKLQGLGRALMLPIAVLPVAALMLRLGQPDLLDLPFIAASGSAIFANLGLLFAIGVGVGIAKENNGAAGLAGAVAFLVLTEGAKALIIVPDEIGAALVGDPAARDAVINAWKQKELAKLSVPAGIICGLAAGYLYNRYHAIKLPEYLSFFGGRRFVPIAAGLFGLVGAAVFGFGFPILEAGVDQLSIWVTAAGSFGLFLYGLLNRLLIVTGLHHILNNIAWFVLGDYDGVTGDLNRFFAGDPTAGAFMSGFFPVMMFGLPAACFAMWRSVRPQRRKAMGGMYLSMALTSFLTGVTEPIEFTFMFVAPLLFLLHAVLTGVSMVIMDLLNVHLGFGFSAGLFDYVLNFSLATNPWLLLPVGMGYFLIYYACFRFAIARFGIKVPGSEAEGDASASGMDGVDSADGIGPAYARALGGAANLQSIDACTTRLRLIVNDSSALDERALRALGAKGILKISDTAVQVVIGPDADRVAGEVRAAIAGGMASPAPAAKPADISPASTGDQPADYPDYIALLGGRDNLVSYRRSGRRDVLVVRNVDAVLLDQLNETRQGRWLRIGDGTFHILG